MPCSIWWLTAVCFAISLTAARAAHTATVENVQFPFAVYAVGNNKHGGLGNGVWDSGSETHTTTLEAVLIEHTVVRISSGWFHTLFTTAEGYAYASGWGDYGQRGDGVGNGCSYCDDKHIPIAVLTDHVIVDVSAGHTFSLFLTADGIVYSVGSNNAGQLGNGDSNGGLQLTPGAVLITHTIAQIDAGNYFSLFLTTNGEAYACGDNYYGQLGGTNSVSLPVPVATSGFMTNNNVIAISAGAAHSLFITTLGTMHGCGCNTYGQLGTGSTSTYVATPVYITSAISQVAAGHHHSLAIGTDGTAYASGSNTYGELCDGSNTDILSLARIATLPDDSFVQVSANEIHSLFLTAKGTVYSCGRNHNGEIGDGTRTDRNTLFAVPTERPVIQVAAGGGMSFFIYGESL
ncbi:hypothetical protein CYMTET_11659 [Cymbomonas tetramitiformis]|uniref:RCC1-like domain-containing protein n=1 Tax=Cymbomonas tetramitiformis TaxID=36881 RepID=A0AAE0GLM2_9CHLO|nr:hypothetical protein CYMTET_11659 [Cymbomonas tetramitiformis]